MKCCGNGNETRPWSGEYCWDAQRLGHKIVPAPYSPPPVTANASAFLHTLVRLLLPALVGWATPALALDHVTLQLKWSHGFQFAGYYVARELGYYREAGLEVRIDEALPGVDPMQPVLAGRAQFGVGTSSLLLARKAGQPVVALAAIFQHSPLVLIARRDQSLQGIRDLVGKRVMIEPQSDELVAYLKREGIPLDRIDRVEHSHDPADLIAGKVAAMSAYSTYEPYDLDRAGLRYHTYTPRAAGIDFYGDNLYTTEREIKTHPRRVEAFRAASLRGWEYAMAHPDEVAALIHGKYSQRHSLDFYRYEANSMAPLMRADLIEVGYMNPGRWRHIADTYADLGLLPRGFSLDGFLYEAKTKPDPIWFYLAAGLIGIVVAIALYIYRINRRLARALATSRAAEIALRASEESHRHLAQHDPLTGLANRALFSDRLGQALAGAKRDQKHLALMFIDLDRFKPVNDTYGHGVGDLLLQEVAQRMRACVRESDTVARIGGDEFVVLLRTVDSEQTALAVAEKIRQALDRPYEIAGHRLDISASLGIALYPDHGGDEIELAKNADDAMYLAKNSGRDTVRMYRAEAG